jgi:hypothetical protein
MDVMAIGLCITASFPSRKAVVGQFPLGIDSRVDVAEHKLWRGQQKRWGWFSLRYERQESAHGEKMAFVQVLHEKLQSRRLP